MKTVNHIRQTMQSLGSILTIVIGFVLMMFMLVVENEPGKIPLVLIVLGIGWYSVNRSKPKLRQRKFE